MTTSAWILLIALSVNGGLAHVAIFDTLEQCIEAGEMSVRVIHDQVITRTAPFVCAPVPEIR